jgi:hypothetical protein
MTQRMQALEKANKARLAAADIKARIKSGDLSVAEAFDAEGAPHITIYALLCAQTRWGHHKTIQLLKRIPVGEHRRLDTLTEREKHAILENLAGRITVTGGRDVPTDVRRLIEELSR